MVDEDSPVYNLDVHGIKDFCRAGQGSRLVWGAVLVVALAALAVQLAVVVQQYHKDEAGTFQVNHSISVLCKPGFKM